MAQPSPTQEFPKPQQWPLPSLARCPVCGDAGLSATVTRRRLPSMQNYVYRSWERAKAAADGAFSLGVCRACGFASNVAFAPDRLVYDGAMTMPCPRR